MFRINERNLIGIVFAGFIAIFIGYLSKTFNINTKTS